MRKIIEILIVTLIIANSITVISTTNIIKNDQIESESSLIYDYFKETYMVPMRDGVRLATDVYLPYKDYPAHGCILIRTPYDKDDIERYLEGQDYFIEDWVSNGWPFVIQDERGLYASEGNPGYFEDSRLDGYDTVEWVAEQDWSNGKIATWGRSAFGINQIEMAGTNPPNLSCQYIGVATSNLYRDICYTGGELRKSFVDYAFSYSEEDFNRVLYNENLTDFWWRFTPEDKQVSVPAILIGGWYDCFSQGTIDAFVDYQYNGEDGAKDNCKLIMGPWTHTQFGYNKTKTGDLTFPENQHDNFSKKMFEDMINQYTMDDGNDFDDWPTVSYYVMGDVDDLEAPGNIWKYSDYWPVDFNETRYYFHGEDLLDDTSPGNNNPITYTYNPLNPVSTRGGNNLVLSQGPKDQSLVENRNDVIVFTSEVLKKPIGVTGQIRAELYVSSDAIDTDFTVKLTDVYPDGRSMLIADGILRMRNRNGFDHWEFIEAGEIYKIEVDLWSTAYIWNEGHQLRVSISSSNSPRFLANSNTGINIHKTIQNPSYKLANNTLHIDSDHPSCIVFPSVHVKSKNIEKSTIGCFEFILKIIERFPILAPLF